MARYYTTAKLSENIRETQEGYLLCIGVPIAREGSFLYTSDETPIDAGELDIVVMKREIDELASPKSLASFEGKPVTLGHPIGDEFVTPDNWRDLAVGFVQNLRRGDGPNSDKILADLLITAKEAIDKVKSKELRQVSAAYNSFMRQIKEGLGVQEGFLGNHVALVKNGRNGKECAIFDHNTVNQRGITLMKFKKKLLKVFGKALDEMPEDMDKACDGDEDVGEMIKGLHERLLLLEKMIKKEGDEVMDDDEEEEMSIKEIVEEDPEFGDKVEGDSELGERLSRVEEKLDRLLGEKSVGDENLEEVYDDDEEAIIETKSMDSKTVSLAEIISPGIPRTRDIKKQALKRAYKTADGRKVIRTLLSGKSFDSAKVDTNLLFNATAEAMKSLRREKVNSTKIFDHKTVNKTSLTPKELNEKNAAFWGKKS